MLDWPDMSSTKIFAAFSDGDMVTVASISNAFQGAFHVWDTLVSKYMGSKLAFMMMDTKVMQRLWDLAEDPRLSPNERLVHLSTFDRVYVRRENMRAVADAIEAFEPTTPNLKAQAEAIRKAWEDGARVLAWQQTTVSCELDWTGMRPREVPDDEDSGRLPFNIDRDAFVGEEILPSSTTVASQP